MILFTSEVKTPIKLSTKSELSKKSSSKFPLSIFLAISKFTKVCVVFLTLAITPTI